MSAASLLTLAATSWMSFLPLVAMASTCIVHDAEETTNTHLLWLLTERIRSHLSTVLSQSFNVIGQRGLRGRGSHQFALRRIKVKQVFLFRLVLIVRHEPVIIEMNSGHFPVGTDTGQRGGGGERREEYCPKPS